MSESKAHAREPTPNRSQSAPEEAVAYHGWYCRSLSFALSHTPHPITVESNSNIPLAHPLEGLYRAFLMGDQARLVALYRCKQCGVRMFECDTRGHLERHGIESVNGNWRSFFVRGKKDTYDRPGGGYKPLYKKNSKRSSASLN